MDRPDDDLGNAFSSLAKSFDQLAANLESLAERIGEPIYRRYDRPFGASASARKIWIRYRQYTTRN